MFIKYFLPIILGMMVFETLSGQDAMPALPANSGERIQLYSDRYLYCVEENLLFSAFYEQPAQIVNSQWSNVLYIELLRWDGTKLAQQKVRIIDGFASGFLKISEHVKSGNYYLRAYTRWMRNYSPYTYSYIPIKIINPFTGETDDGPLISNESVQSYTILEPEFNEDIVFFGIEETYKTRQLVEVEISVRDTQISGPFCLSVSKEGNFPCPTGVIFFTDPESEETINKQVFLPDIRGITVSGKLIDQKEQIPLANEEIILSSAVNPFYFSNIISGSSGEFYFSIPYISGSYQFCLTAENKDLENVEFLLTSDYCNQVIVLPYVPFALNQDEEALAEEIISNVQLQNKYALPPSAEKVMENLPPFYGKAKSLTNLKDYIELDDLQEFFFELVPDVYIKYDGREPYLKLHDMSSLSSSFLLLLFDNIPVSNNHSLLGISTREIDRIEVINGGYVVGKNLYSGLISIYSTKGDLAGMEIQKNSRFFQLDLFSKYKLSFTNIGENYDSRIAETQNLIYWNPAIVFSGNTPKKFSFYTSDAAGEYTISLRGAGKNGKPVFVGRSNFTVK